MPVLKVAGSFSANVLSSPRMSTPNTTSPPRHLSYLDSARGIAALMVLFGHYCGWKFHELTSIKLAGFIFNASDAVSFFFVLSGMVLTYQYVVLGNSLDMRKYYINRIMRLLPAFFIAVLMNALYWQRHNFNWPDMYRDFIRNNNQFWEEAILIRPHTKFFGAGWTLVTELAASFFIPFLIVIGKNHRRLLWWLILSSVLVSRVTEMFIFHFTLGVIISFYYRDLEGPELAEKKWYKFRYLILAAAVVLFSIRRIETLSPFGPTFYYFGEYLQISLFQYTGLASFVFIIWMIRNKAIQHILNHGILIFLGKISYGVYLMHWLVVTIIYDNWDFLLTCFPNLRTTFLVMMMVCFLVTVILATILHYVIELPFIRMGKRFTAKLKPSLVIN